MTEPEGSKDQSLKNFQNRPQKPIDPGLQPERTTLAWYRSTFACLINGLLLLNNAVKLKSLTFWFLSLLMLGLSLLLYVYLYLQNADMKATRTLKALSSLDGLLLKQILAVTVAFCAAVLLVYFLRNLISQAN